MIEGLGDPYDAYNKKVKKGAHCLYVINSQLSHSVVALHEGVERVKRLFTPPSPSEIVTTPARLAEIFGSDNSNIYLDQAPATIFNRVLAAFQQRFDHLEQINVTT